MPISIVVGGQYGSEGKGKTALHLTRSDPNVSMVVRPGGTNSGHTGYDDQGRRITLRQLPIAALREDVQVVIPAGSYIDVDLLFEEIERVGLAPERLLISPNAHVIRHHHREAELAEGLVDDIGSTGSGTGAAVRDRISRTPLRSMAMRVLDDARLAEFVTEHLIEKMRACLAQKKRIVIEGTQGFGLSVLHAEAWPKATSRDTTAAGFLSETGLSPLDVDDVVMVLRTFPIRVAGDSGPLANETTWKEIARNAGAENDITEFTTVTGKVRRVGRFDPGIVKEAISSNAPTRIVLNHVDYVSQGPSADVARRGFVLGVERQIGRSVDLIGIGPFGLVDRKDYFQAEGERRKLGSFPRGNSYEQSGRSSSQDD